jgi:hypothetical protein
MINSGYAVQRMSEKCQQSYLSSSNTGTQSNSGGKSAKFLSYALPPPATEMADSEKIRPVFFVLCSEVQPVRVPEA